MRVLVIIMLLAHVALAAPSKAEVDAFAKQMGASFDEVAGYEAKAEAAEKAGKLDEAQRFWMGLYQGATQLRQHALLAARAGTFQNPMKFPTKSGALTAAQYLQRLEKLAAKADIRESKAAIAVANAENKRRKQTYVQGVAANVVSLETLLKKAKRASKSEADDARLALANVERNAQSLAVSVRDAEKQGRAPKAASYPTSPKPLTATALVAYLGTVGKDAKAARAELDKKFPAAKPAPKTAAAKPAARTNAPASAPSTQTSAEPAQPAAAEPAAPVCETGQINCDNGMTSCCEGERCLAAGYIVYSDHFEADYYQCMDPAFATSPPTL